MNPAPSPQKKPLPVALVVADVDGTLVTKEKQITPLAKDAVRRLRDSGIKFTITSSRPPRGLERIIRELGLTEPIAAFNGGMVVTPEFQVLEEKLLEEDAARQAVEIIMKHKVDPWLYNQRDWFVRDPRAPHVEHEVATGGFEPVVVPHFVERFFERLAKSVAVTDDFAAIQKCEEEICRELSGKVSATRSQSYYLDITHPQANKGQGVAALARLLNIPLTSVATIGDGANDVFMFRNSGLSIAMGNAAPEVQAAAMFVTSSNQEEGFARAMQSLVLAQPVRQ
jgi:Cof subfamily protein (haloacid dehalogenase superfamily)